LKWDTTVKQHQPGVEQTTFLQDQSCSKVNGWFQWVLLALFLFAHCSGSSRHSSRNQFVARTIREAGIGTLLFDLLTREEEAG
jgi:hypothetical protein